MSYEETEAAILSADKAKLEEIVDIFNFTFDKTMQEREALLSSLERYTYGHFLRNNTPDEKMKAYFDELDIIQEEIKNLRLVGKLILLRELQLRGEV